jgi:hypothetical protein
MTIYNVSSKQLIDDYAVLQTLENNEFAVGGEIIVTNVGGDFDGTFDIHAIPQYLYTGINDEGFPTYDYNIPISNQVLFICTGDDVARVATNAGEIEYSNVCTWIDDADIMDWLGIAVATAADEAFLIVCAAAANAFVFRRRSENNYFDSPSVVPSSDVKLGTIMYGGALYRQRGSAGSDFAAFDGMGVGTTNGLSAMVKQLLGINRAVVA